MSDCSDCGDPKKIVDELTVGKIEQLTEGVGTWRKVNPVLPESAMRQLMPHGRDREPFPTDYDPCPTCAYKIKNPLLEQLIQELEEKVAKQEHACVVCLERQAWKLDVDDLKAERDRLLKQREWLAKEAAARMLYITGDPSRVDTMYQEWISAAEEKTNSDKVHVGLDPSNKEDVTVMVQLANAGFVGDRIHTFALGQLIISKRHHHEEVMKFCCLRPGNPDFAIIMRSDGRLSEKPVKDLEPYSEEED